jgi:hypothetical protein
MWLQPEFLSLVAPSQGAADKNMGLVLWIKSIEFLHVPRRLNPAAIPDHATIIYTFGLVVLAGIVGTIMSIPLWWPASKGWVSHYNRMGIWKSAALAVFFLFLTIDLPLGSVWVDLDFGYDPVALRLGGATYIGHEFSDLALFKEGASWCGSVVTQIYVTSGFIGYCRYLYNKRQS